MTAASALPNRLTSAQLATTDVLPIDDASASETKGVLIGSLFGAQIPLGVQYETANTNAIQYQDFQLSSSGAPANGLGFGWRVAIETTAGLTIGGAWRLQVTDITSASEDYKWVGSVMIAGAAAADVAELINTGFNAPTGKVYSVAGTQVLGPRATGWGAASSTLSRTAYPSYAGQTLTGSYVQATQQANDDALKLLSQKVAALITDLTAHGLIGT